MEKPDDPPIESKIVNSHFVSHIHEEKFYIIPPFVLPLWHCVISLNFIAAEAIITE
jgi:hypothetical protein